MLIILEGPDGAGKTTLAAHLRQSLPNYAWILRSNSRPRGWEDLKGVGAWIDHFPTGLVLICDRHPYISEEVYGPVIRPEKSPPFIIDDREHPERLENLVFQLSGALIIYCRPGINLLRERANQENQMPGVMEHLGELLDNYDLLMENLRDGGIDVAQCGGQDPTVITNVIKEWVEARL